MADHPDIPALVVALTEASYSGCASFDMEAGAICSERGSDLVVWCDKCLLRAAATTLSRLTNERDVELSSARKTIERLNAQISDYGWAESARHAERTGGTQ